MGFYLNKVYFVLVKVYQNFSSKMFKPGVSFAVVLCLVKFGESAKYAHCKFHGDKGASGHLCLKEDDSGQIYGRMDVHIASGISGPFGVHVHKRAPKSSHCYRMGPHFNVGDKSVDEGNIGTFELDQDAIHDTDFKLDSHLNLNLYRDHPSGIVGRGVKIHLGSGRSVCCVLKKDSSIMFDSMKAEIRKHQATHQHDHDHHDHDDHDHGDHRH